MKFRFRVIFFSVVLLLQSVRAVAFDFNFEIELIQQKFWRWFTMVSDGIEFLANKDYELFFEDEKPVTSMRSIMLFDRLWKRLEKECRNFYFPRRIIWVNGAPGAGKGVNTRNIMRAMGISAKPLIVSDLLQAPEFQSKIDQGLLVDDEEVTFLVFKNIAEVNRKDSGLIVDGYPRTFLQAECIHLLKKKINAEMVAVVLLIDEKTSINRQRIRGLEAIAHNQQVQSTGEGTLVEVRATDIDDEVARKRYATFRDQTIKALRYMKEFTQYHDINAKGSFDEVRDRINSALKRSQ